MSRSVLKCVVAGVGVAAAQGATAGTDIFFNPLTQSAAVASPNHVNELNTPWQTPPGLTQVNLMSLIEVEADVNQSIIRVPGAGTSASMFDMVSYDDDGRYLFIPHETPVGAGVSRYDIENDISEVLLAGDLGGLDGDWSNDYAAFDPSTFTPNQTVLLGEEWAGEGRIIEVLNPFAPVGQIQYRELQSIPNVAHEGLRFGGDDRTLYFVDEWNSGSLYKFIATSKDDYTRGQTFVLKVDAYDPIGANADWSDPVNVTNTRTGIATWVALTDKSGNALTDVDPFRNGPTNDPNTNDDTRGGRPAADEIGATPYGRPEDMEVGRLASGNEVIYFTATSENSVYSVEELGWGKAIVRLTASEADTPKNLGFPATTGVLNSPDNLAQDALGNIYIIEDAPNGSDIGGDIWFIRDADSDGVAESLDHFMSIQVDGAEATGMIFNPADPTEFVVAVQHPDTTDLPDGFGDAIWMFDLEDIVPPPCDEYRWDSRQTCTNTGDYHFVKLLEQAGHKRNGWGHWDRGRGWGWDRHDRRK